jgi:hypothetical protein
VGHVSKFNGFLCMEVSRARVSQFASKLAEARQWMIHVAPSRKSREDQVKDSGWCTWLSLLCHFYCIRSYGYFSLLVLCLDI